MHFKIILLGEATVGKTSLIQIIKKSVYMKTDSVPTFDAASCNITAVDQRGKEFILHIHDTAGLERFRAIPRNYYRGTDAVILVYNITRCVMNQNVKCKLYRLMQIVRDYSHGTCLAIYSPRHI